MLSTAADRSTLTLSICIATFNRAEALRATLQRLLDQLRELEYRGDCEIIVADNASDDRTEVVVLDFKRQYENLRYLKQEVNVGWERNFNAAVEAACGQYCWLMPDDDLLRPRAIEAVWSVLDRGPSLVVVNADHVDAEDSSVLLLRKRLDIDTNQVYEPHELDRCFEQMGWHLQYVGAVVIMRSIWLERMRESYYGSWFPQIGVIFQAPLPGVVIALAEVLISVNLGGQFWVTRIVEIFGYRWPLLVRSLGLSDGVKERSILSNINLSALVTWRASGMYSSTDYHQWIRPQLKFSLKKLLAAAVAVLPGTLLNVVLILRWLSSADRAQRLVLRSLMKSPYYLGRRLRT